MKKWLFAFGLVTVPNIAMADGAGINNIRNFVLRVNEVIINPLLGFLFAAAFLLFIVGVVRYLMARGIYGSEEINGRQHMLWGLVGMFVMFAAFSIMQLIANTIGAAL